MKKILFFVLVLCLAFQVKAADGTLANVSGTTGVSGSSPGAYLTNGAWVRDVIMWRATALTTSAGSTNYLILGLGGITPEPTAQLLMPTSGYLSNFTVSVYTAFASATNMTFTIYTNQYATAGVGAGITCTLIGTAVAGATTNDSTHSVTLSAGMMADIAFYASSAVPSSIAAAAGRIEWWHQLP